MGRTFARIILCSTDDFPSHKNDKVKGWVEHNGGTFSKEMHPKVTHLLASKQAWQTYYPIGTSSMPGPFLTTDMRTVKEARRLKTVKIVKFGWLEDSLLTKSRRPLKTDEYDWSQRSLAKLKARKAMAGQGDNTVDVRPREGCDAATNSKLSKDDAIERAGWDEYDICMARLILDRRRVRQGLSRVRGEDEEG